MSGDVLTIRCSALPRIWGCGASAYADTDGIIIGGDTEASSLGTAFHRWADRMVQGIDADPDNYAIEYHVDTYELRMLCGCARQTWRMIGKHFPPSITMSEHRMSATLGPGIELTGTCDLTTDPQDGILPVLDWKSGRVDSDYSAQKKGYAWLRLQEVPEADTAMSITAWLRDGQLDVQTWTRDQLNAWAEELIRRIMQGESTFSPSGRCVYCPRQNSCEGRRKLVAATMAELADPSWPPFTLTAENRLEVAPLIADIRSRIKVVENAIERFDASLRVDVMTNGPLPIGDGREIKAVEVKRRELDYRIALPVLLEHLSESEVDMVTKVSLAQCEQMVQARSPKGQGAGNKRFFNDQLREAGAVRESISHTIREGKAGSTV